METEYLVIGAGSAGNVVARRLLDAGKQVTVLEAGDQDINPDIAHLNTLGALWHSPQDWNYYTTEQAGASGRRMHLPRGKVMGGSHALNASIWVRGDRWDYDSWAEAGCAGWSWEDVLPVFKQIENFDGGASDTRGTDGLLDVVADFPRNPVQEDMLAGAQEIGLPLNPDYNSGSVEGVSRMQLNVRDGRRFNTWHAYLKPVMDHPNLTLVTGAHVRRLIVEDGSVTGVEFEYDGELRTVRAGETILCAGAINSAELLLRSGIGPAAELAEIGVEPVLDLPGVGKNLQDHLLAPVIFSTGAREVPDGEVAPAEVHFFAKSRPDLPVPDTQPIFFSVPMYSQDYGLGEMTGPANGFSMLGGLVRPASRGEITLTGPAPEDPLRIDLGALSEQADVDALVASVRQCREIGRTEALAGWEPKELHPGPAVSDSDEDLARYVRDSVVTYHHQVGTCRMGTDDLAVVDPADLRVRGLSGIRIADASVMPLVTTGNTNAPTVMIAERAAGMITG
ncbi:GMC family oxidoreductase [Arthrobacter caoxuetaonis]|uniref:GMC family oxidoreductase n=1 Tax=Arthrobacter caoxuetaonis TaxID=2886935 RepID=UPI001D154F16|nr:GMC family oxidoreductase N-terminal domain-containing protein [Arthrobacter caoxuetaonis]MCC3281867.1 GMC family oxidoreductase N-terminal domain-containing protein [Arthrobacter caoxuetaonis]MCC3283094.1 GMC family oxidoreductase N-terminal domain-containing protein [Arthrobacter caoxuetaonis]